MERRRKFPVDRNQGKNAGGDSFHFRQIIMVMLKVIQVGIVADHFQCQSGRKPIAGASVMPRIRHCVECPRCLTRYLVSCSPYENGSYLLPTIEGCQDEYTLYCRCKAAASRWKASEFKSCEVSPAAFERGYGTPQEIVEIRPPRQEWKSVEKRRA